jgi:hypothetical protein
MTASHWGVACFRACGSARINILDGLVVVVRAAVSVGKTFGMPARSSGRAGMPSSLPDWNRE